MAGTRKPTLIAPNPEEIAAFMEHPTYQGFLRDICERPEDDTPRLILADWLDDLDTAESRLRAWFIRWQIEHHGNAWEANTEETLTALHFYKRKSGIPPRWKLWSNGVADLLHITDREHVRYKRGFAATAATTYDTWFRYAAGKSAVVLQPVEDVWVSDRRPQFMRVIAPNSNRTVALHRWMFSSEPGGSSIITLAIDEALKPWCGGLYEGHNVAMTALSTGLIQHARQLAGLPWKVQ